MEIEAALPPAVVRLEKTCKSYAVRVLQLPSDHPVRLCMTNFRNRADPSAPPPVQITELPKARTSQLIRIMRCISNTSSGFFRLEKLRIKLSAPWREKSDIRISIPTAPSERDTVIAEHTNLVTSLQNERNLIYYTDGSKLQDEATGAGFYRISNLPRTETASKSWFLGRNMEIMDAEIFAIAESVKDAELTARNHPSIRHVWIFTDSQAAIKRLPDLDPKPGQSLVHVVHQSVLKLEKKFGVAVNFHWIPAHSHIAGNDKADRNAKKGAQNEKNEPARGYTSITHVKRVAKESCLNHWQTEWDTKKKGRSYLQNFGDMAKPRWKLPKLDVTAPKRIWSAFLQLKFGHGYFKSYLVRLQDYEDNRCSGTCHAVQSPEHLLLACRTYQAEREKLKDAIKTTPLTLPLLYANATNQRATLEFIKETGIATRRWLLQQTD
jgi:ribonuclease HI